MNTTLPANRAFLIWLTDEADPSDDRLCGRVEHVQSGRRHKFESHLELRDFVMSILEEETATQKTADSERSTK